MGWRETVEEILRLRSLSAAEWLGSGDEAEVYAFDAERVIRFHKEPVNRELADRCREFYATLDSTRVSFRVPFITEAAEHGGVYYTVERRIAGVSLSDALPALEGTVRYRALRTYVETSLAVRQLRYPQEDFGEVLAPSPIRTRTWPEFVLSRAIKCLEAQYQRVAAHVDRVDRSLHRLEGLLAQCPCPRSEVVHGDYYPANVIVSPGGDVTGVIDFGPLTVMGDPRMDAAAAVLYLAGMPGVTSDDKRIALECIREHGADEAVMALYRIFYAFRLLAAHRQGVFAWCIATLQSASE